MLLAAIIVLVALVTLPVIVRLSIIIITWATRGEKGVDLLHRPSKTIEQFRLKRKRLFYGIFVLFFVLIIAALGWVFYEFMHEFNIALGINGQFALYMAIAWLIIMSGTLVISVKRAQRIRKRMPPPPEPGVSEKVLLEYRNRAYDESMRGTVQFFYTHTRLIVTIIIVFFAVLLLIILSGFVMEYLIE